MASSFIHPVRRRAGLRVKREYRKVLVVGFLVLGVLSVLAPTSLQAQEPTKQFKEQKRAAMPSPQPFEQKVGHENSSGSLSFYTTPIVESTLALFRLIYQTPKGITYLSRPHPFDTAVLQDFFFVTSTEDYFSPRHESKGPEISIEQAIAALIAEQPQRREDKANGYGLPKIFKGAEASQGARVFESYCGNCHGEKGQGPPQEYNNGGKGLGPFGSTQPYLYLKVLPLDQRFAGGSTPEFAERSAFGVHATLPEMSGAAVLSQEDWANLQAYVAQFDGPQDFSK